MLRKSLAAMFVTVFVGITGAAFANPAASGTGRPDTSTSERTARMSETYSVLHAVAQWSVGLSEMADKRAKSDLVKNFAREVVTTNRARDAKLLEVAKKDGIDVKPLDPQTEEGKSVLDRMKGETTLLSSLEGDAFDKEYMTLVTNTQQSVIRVLKTASTMARDQEAKQFFDDTTTSVQKRLKTAQDVMAKVYGDKI